MKILAISGSLRAASHNTALLRAMARLAPVDVTMQVFSNLGQLPLFNPDLEASIPPVVLNFQHQLNNADAVLIASPEYAHGVTGAIKNALDWMVGNETFVNKPVALLNASPRAVHAQAALRETLTMMSARIIEKACIALPILGSSLDEEGIYSHPVISASLREALQTLQTEVIRNSSAEDGENSNIPAEIKPPLKNIPVAIVAAQAAMRAKVSIYPEPFASRMEGREKRPLGDIFELTNFGVNLTHLKPGSGSALRHAHSKQDEFIYILQGNPVLITDAGETSLSEGMCAGFKAGTGNASQLVNRTGEEVIYLELGDRSANDSVTYPDDDLQANFINGGWQFFHKDGKPYK